MAPCKSLIRIIIAFIFVLNPAFLLHGQENVIHGKITTFESIPLIGASIKVKSTDEVVFTDEMGIFTVRCFPKDKLRIKASGFASQTIKIEENTNDIVVNMKLNPGQKSRDLAVGYGHVKDVEKLDAMSGINDKDMDFSNYSDIYDIIRGRFPGVLVNEKNEIIIRGEGTLHEQAVAALLVVDGIVVDERYFESVHPTEIKSINVLKGSAAAIYGVRGANGVVIVDTKGRE